MNKQLRFRPLCFITSLLTLTLGYGGSGTPVDAFSQDAEADLSGIIDNTEASYELRDSGDPLLGTYSFHLVHPTFTSNSFQLSERISVTTDTVLGFFSKIGFATPNQISKVQLSTDNGSTWTETVFEKPGVSGSPTDSSYTYEEISLASYAGQSVCVRFLFEFTSGSAYTDTGSHVGWLIDDIQIGNDNQKLLYSIGEPSDSEQLYLEYINRARVDAVAEAVRLTNITDANVVSAVNAFGISSADIITQFQYYVDNDLMQQNAQPLSFNENLSLASDAHSQDMFANAFQGHVSSSSPPAGDYASGATMAERVTSTGYSWGNLGENVFSHAKSEIHGHAGFNIDWGVTVSEPIPEFVGQGMQNQAGHRKTIHSDNFKEIGIGVVTGTNGSVGPQIVTQNFARQLSSPSFITGVVYDDLDNDSFYDLGEGVSGVTVNVTGSPFYAVTSSSGGYSVPVTSDKTYAVTFSGSGVETRVFQATVASSRNVKVDFKIEAPSIDAVNDSLGILAENTVSLPSVFLNDLANGVTATASTTRLPTIISDDGDSGISFNANGTATLPSDLAAGSYSVVYEICLKDDNSVCDQATLSFQVPVSGSLDAVNDSLGLLAENTVSLPSVFLNDLANGVTATASTTHLPTIISDDDDSGISFNANGTATLPSDLAAGSYSVVYEICLKDDNSVCDQATLSFQLPVTGFQAFLLDHPEIGGGWEEDYDGDGLPDGAEYAMGLDPTDSSDARSIMNFSRTPSSSGNTVTLSSPLSEKASDVLYQFQTSSNLESWSSLQNADYSAETLSATATDISSEKFFIQWIFTQQ